MVICEFNKNFYYKIYTLISIILMLILIYFIYNYLSHKRVFDVTKIQFQLNRGAEEVFKQKIVWRFEDSQLIGELSFPQKKLQLIYYLHKKRIGYIMIEYGTHNSLQLPCLNIVQVLPVNTIKLLYKKLLSNMNDYAISKNILLTNGLYVEYVYKAQNNQITTNCFIYYKK